jgi:hypothetical protein
MAITAAARTALYCCARMEAIMHNDLRQLLIRLAVAIGISVMAVSAIGAAVAQADQRPVQGAAEPDLVVP